MKPKTVLISFDTHTPYLAFRVSRLAQELRRRGLEEQVRLQVVLIAGKEASYGWQGDSFESLYGGVPVRVLSDTFRGLGLRAYLRLSTVKTCLKFFGLLLKLRPKMVLVGGYDRPESMIAGLTAWLFRWRVGVMHDSRFNDAESFGKNVAFERLKSYMVRRYQFFMCSGQECVDYSRFLAGGKKPAYRCGWNVVDNQAIGEAAEESALDEGIYQHFGIPSETPFFLMPIRFIGKKNAYRVLQAFARYRESSAGSARVSLVICGQGELEKSYRECVQRLGLGDAVQIVPWLDYSQVPRACRLSSGVILASTHDQWGLIINEALAAGAPVLVSNRCGAHELVKNGVNGFTFAPGDVAHLASLMGDLASQPELLGRLRAAAAPSMADFSIDQFLRVYFDAFTLFGVLPASDYGRDPAPTSEQPAPVTTETNA